jgi:hypothetical protein
MAPRPPSSFHADERACRPGPKRWGRRRGPPRFFPFSFLSAESRAPAPAQVSEATTAAPPVPEARSAAGPGRTASPRGSVGFGQAKHPRTGLLASWSGRGRTASAAPRGRRGGNGLGRRSILGDGRGARLERRIADHGERGFFFAADSGPRSHPFAAPPGGPSPGAHRARKRNEKRAGRLRCRGPSPTDLGPHAVARTSPRPAPPPPPFVPRVGGFFFGEVGKFFSDVVVGLFCVFCAVLNCCSNWCFVILG